MNKTLKENIIFPLETVKVKVGLGGIHYHLPDCPSAQPLVFPRTKLSLNLQYSDYVEIEVPKQWVEKHLDIPMFGKTYRSHIKACKELIKRSRA